MKRLLVHEYFSGGGCAGRRVPAPLLREGAAMRDALAADLARLARHRVLVTVDPRFPLRRRPAGVEEIAIGARQAGLRRWIRPGDALWLVAPETDGCLERLAADAEAAGVELLGPSAWAIRQAANKARLAKRLGRHRLPHPPTRLIASPREALDAAREIGLPAVVKPARGAGCEGVRLARTARELLEALPRARRLGGASGVLVQRFVAGTHASVSLLCHGRRSVALAVNAQTLDPRFAYRGGVTPLAHPLARRATAVARRACRALPGLKGYVGVDLVLTDSEAVVIEVNPRLTTAYLGVRAALDVNVAGLALAACAGRLPALPRPRRTVRFSAAGRVAAA